MDAGFLRLDRMPGEPGFGQIVPCPDCPGMGVRNGHDAASVARALAERNDGPPPPAAPVNVRSAVKAIAAKMRGGG